MIKSRLLIACVVFLLVFTEYRSGDLNYDWRITVTDLVQMRQMVEGLTKPSYFSDFNYDGKVNEIDLNIMRYILSR